MRSSMPTTRQKQEIEKKGSYDCWMFPMLTKKELARDRLSKAVKKGFLIRSPFCEMCGKAAKTDGHHRNYNQPLVVIWLCRKCHMREDGRLAQFYSTSHGLNPNPLPMRQCKTCKRLTKMFWFGECHACNEYLRRNGKPRPFKDDGRIEKWEHRKFLTCLRCKRVAGIVGNPIKGFCKSCYTVLHRKSWLHHNRYDAKYRAENRRKKKAQA